MTKLVAGYVLGRITSPHQFKFVFVFMSASNLLSSQPDRGRKQWLGTVRHLCLWCACDLPQPACVVVGVGVGCYRVGGDSIDAAAPVARRLTLATSLTAALYSISDSSSSSSRVDVVVAPAAAAAAVAAGGGATHAAAYTEPSASCCNALHLTMSRSPCAVLQ